MNITANAVPIQYRSGRMIQLVKRFLHTRVGAFIGYHLGISGFNRVDMIVNRFQREYHDGDALGRNEFVSLMDDGLDADGNQVRAPKYGVYRVGKKGHSFNSRVDAGAALAASLISGTTLGGLTSPSSAKYIAISTSSLTPAKGDTTLSGETSASGLARALGSAGTYTAPSTLDGAASYVLSKVFTAGVAGPTTIQSAAIFDAASLGNMLVEANLSSSAVLGLNDQLTINWTINL